VAAQLSSLAAPPKGTSTAAAACSAAWAGWSPQTLIYVRAGGAWVDTQLDFTRGAGSFNTSPSAPLFDTKYSGWTVGGGVEWMIFGNWSAFAEYNFYDFRSKTLLVPPARTPVANGGSNIFGNTAPPTPPSAPSRSV
jgi:opacity protein-like surface antigen